MVDLNLDELYAKQLSPIDVSNALNLQNLILPAGTAKLAGTEYQIKVNSSPLVARRTEQPAHQDRERRHRLYERRGAGARRLFGAEQHRAHQRLPRRSDDRNPQRQGLHADIVDAVKAALPRILATVPPELKVTTLADQSIFVRASIQGVVREALIAAGLTGMMILLFLGSWRSTLIVCISIPLSILASLCILSLLGETINVMTLGGLALAVGILVDDATVEIENTHRNIGMRKPLVRAVLDGAAQIAVPTFVSTLAICIVFVPVLLLTGTAQISVHAAGHGGGVRHAGFVSAVAHAGSHHGALICSEPKCRCTSTASMARRAGGKGLFWRVHHLFNGLFERLRFRYIGLLDWSLRHRGRVLAAFGVVFVASLGLVWLVGEDFFPTVDSGQMRLHARAPAGTRIEETEVRFAAIEREIRAADSGRMRSTPSSTTSGFPTVGPVWRKATSRPSPAPTARS